MSDDITTFVTFKVPSDAVDKFKAEWLKDAEFIGRQAGQKGGALYRRVGSDEKVEFINVALWESEHAMTTAREAAIKEQEKNVRSQALIFEDLGVLVHAENYVIEVPY